jgi:hypothetical protein
MHVVTSFCLLEMIPEHNSILLFLIHQGGIIDNKLERTSASALES